MNIGFLRHSYEYAHGQSSSKTYIEDYNGAGQVIRRLYPSEYR